MRRPREHAAAVHGDHRVTGVPVVSGLLIEVSELGLPVGVLSTLDGLGVGLQTEAFLQQQPATV